MQGILILLLSISISVGIFNIASNIMKIPHKDTSKAMIATTKINSTKIKGFDILKQNLAHFLSKYVRMNEFKREALQEKLKTSQMMMSPEEFISSALVKPILVVLLAAAVFFLSLVIGISIPMFRILFQIISFLLIIAAVLLYFKQIQEIDKKIKKKREEIESELPRFVSIISKNVVRDKNILTMLERYEKTAGNAFSSELKITIADMKSGNEETALMRMESRVNSTALSDAVRGLISTIQGNSTQTYWENLEIKFSDMARQSLEREALKVPAKIKKLCASLLFCFIATYFAVFGVVIAENMQKF